MSHATMMAEERRDRVRAARQRRLTIGEIARREGVTERTISRDIEALGLKTIVKRHFVSDELLAKARPLLEDGMGYREAARTLGTSQYILARYLPGMAMPNEESVMLAVLTKRYNDGTLKGRTLAREANAKLAG